jgi:hypothetical protein
MSKRGDRAIGESQDGGDMVFKGEKGLSIRDLTFLRPSDVIRFSVYDHEETKLFGVLRDEMMERRRGESVVDWQARCTEVGDWNRRRSKAMTAVFVAKVEERYGSDNEAVQMLKIAHGLALGSDEPKELGSGGTKLLTGGEDERDSG